MERKRQVCVSHTKAFEPTFSSKGDFNVRDGSLILAREGLEDIYKYLIEFL